MSLLTPPPQLPHLQDGGTTAAAAARFASSTATRRADEGGEAAARTTTTTTTGKAVARTPAMQLATTRMKDDPKTNMAFVASVRRHPVLYDYTMPGHSSRELQDEAWHRVAVECGDSVGNCKERWKNLRASLCRHLRQQQQQAGHGQGQRPKKPYYLAEHMEFVVPFTKTRPTAGSVSNSLVENAFDPLDYMDEVKHEVDDEPRPETSADGDGDGSASIDDDDIVQNSLGSSWADHGDGPAVLQVLDGPLTTSSSKKRKRRDTLEAYADEADLNFLKSLLPDMALMSARQKNSFKMAVLTAIEKIVYNSPSDSEAESRRGQPHATQSGTS